MDWHTWMAFFAASWVIAISPGSGAVLSMSHGLSYGVRKTGATILGLELGLLFILIVAGAGVGSLLIASELAFTVVKVLGACYLIYLGFSQWRAGSAGTLGGAVLGPGGEATRRLRTDELGFARPPTHLGRHATNVEDACENRMTREGFFRVSGRSHMVEREAGYLNQPGRCLRPKEAGEVRVSCLGEIV